MNKQDLIFNIYNKADSIYLNEPELTDLLFKYMTVEQIKKVDNELNKIVAVSMK